MITQSLNVPKIYNVNQSQLLKFKKKKKFCCSSNISSLEVSIGKQISIHFTTSCGSSETGSIHLSCRIQHSPKRFFFFFLAPVRLNHLIFWLYQSFFIQVIEEESPSVSLATSDWELIQYYP